MQFGFSWAARLALLTAMSVCLLSCGSDDGSDAEDAGRATARIVSNRAQLVGGKRALGDVGDFLMENERIRVVIQKEGFSRGFGVYGGGLIDADLRRPQEVGNSGEALGNDQFAEYFPAFLVQAVNVDEVHVLDDGSTDGTARVEASGIAGDFFELVALLNRAVTGSNESPFNPASPPRIRYSTIYELAPNAQYVTTRFRIQNISDGVLNFPNETAITLGAVLGLDLTNFTVPVADVALFGATSTVFMPGVGFDLRFGLERAYARGIDFPAFPGQVTEFVATRGQGTSYGLIVEESDRNYVYNKRDAYDDGQTPITRSSILVPFNASSITALFYEDAPPSLEPGEFFEVVKYFVVGSGDVGSVLDVINEIRGEATGRLGGQVFNALTGAPEKGLSVVVYQRLADGTRRPYSQYDLHEGGNFAGTLVPGFYSLKVVGKGRPATDLVDFQIDVGKTTSLRVGSTPPGRIFVRMLDENGDLLPGKATAVGIYGPEFSGMLTTEFLYDLEAGEDFRSTDLVTDDPDDPSTRQFIEAVGFAKLGNVELLVRPGEYDVVSSRGPEYDTVTTHVTVRAAETATVSHRLTRVMDTTGWMAMDAHIHSELSIDSAMDLDTRIAAVAAEGVEIPVATDHNYVTDYGPAVARNDLTKWLHPIVGLEMTTLESGHFNGYPLRYEVGEITKGSFEWACRPPDDIFEELRQLGSLDPNETIVQVNHPRDTILGYYGQYNRDALTGEENPPTGTDALIAPTGPAFIEHACAGGSNDGAGCCTNRDCPGGECAAGEATTFSFDYDAVELLNGKLYYEVRHYRVPDELPPGELPDEVPPAGTILFDSDDEVAFPGVVDDWFNLLNSGERYVGVGTGDSHTGYDEPGQFRTMIYVGVDSPSQLSDRMVVNALRSRRAVSTNGPLVDFWINDPQAGVMGQTIRDDDGLVSLSYSLTSAPWIGVGRINIYRNGQIVLTRELDEGRDLAAEPYRETVELDLATDELGNPIDSWFVIEAIGYENMFPVIRTAEIPPLLITDALASLAGPLGLAGDDFGALRPPEIFPVTAYAITNPVWVTTHAGEFIPPGPVPREEQNLPQNDSKFQAGIVAEPTVPAGALTRETMKQSRLGRVNLVGHKNVPLFYPRAGNPADIRKVFGRMGHLGRHVSE